MFTAAPSAPALVRAKWAAVSVVEAKIGGCVKDILGSAINTNQPFLDAGLDSLTVLELCDAVKAAVGIEVPSTVVFDYPCVAAMSDFIVSQMHPEVVALNDNSITGSQPNVIYGGGTPRGMLGVVGSSSQISRDALNAGGTLDAIFRVPLGRWCLDTPTNSQPAEACFGSFVADVEMFDSDLFNVSTSEAVLMDPQQRMLLEAAWEAKAGVAEDISPDRAGIIVGISWNEYCQMVDVVSAYTATGGALSVACGRVSYTFGLQGICLSIDTASSSSLVAAHVAITSIMSGEADSVTSCGVNVTLRPHTTEMFTKAGMLSKDGRCKTLDFSADGYVRGEACVALELLILAGKACVALHSGILVASAVNQDGRSSSLTAPNGPSQQRAIRSTLGAAGMDPSTLDGLEMHGTGTSLGDPIEVGALHAVLVAPTQTPRLAPLTLSAVKSHMGHTEPAAGAVGLLHAVMEARGLSAQAIVHLTAINPHLTSLTRKAMTGAVDSMGLPRQYAAAAAVASRFDRPTQRGVSSFAFQGTNAHVMVAGPGSFYTAAVVYRGRAALWTRERLWTTLPRHPLLQTVAPILATSTVRFEACISVAHQMYLWDHRVAGRGLFPAAAFLEVGSSAQRLIHDAPSTVCGVAITSPFVLPSTIGVRAVVVCSVNMLSGDLEISSSAAGRPNLTAQCRVIHTIEVGVRDQTAGMKAAALHDTHCESTAAPTSLGRIVCDPTVLDGENAGLCMPPTVLDANLQLADAFQLLSFSSKLHIPAGIETYWAASKAGQTGVWASATSRPASMSDHTIFADSGRVVHLAGMKVKPAGASKQPVPTATIRSDLKAVSGDVMYEVAWVVAAQAPSAPQTSRARLTGPSYSPHRPQRQAATGIQAAQHAAASYVPRIAVQTTGAMGSTTSHASGSEVWGIVRAAAPELQSSTVFQGSDGDLASGPVTLPQQARVYGAQGITVRGGSIATPAIYPSSMVSRPDHFSLTLIRAVGSIMRDGDDAALQLHHALALRAASTSASALSPCASLHHGATLVTGGLGDLGQLVASWDVRNGGTHITLLGRSGRTGEVESSLIMSGACVTMTRGDVSSVEEASSAVHVSNALVQMLLHAGGLLRDSTIPNQTAGHANAVLAPKCIGMTRLDDQTHALAMRSSVLFSSVASLLGSSGQANYCAANGWLDAQARVAVSQGRTATSVQWGAWGGGGGMAGNATGTIRRMERLGIGVLTRAQGLCALEALTRASGQSVVAVIPFIWDRFLRSIDPVPVFFHEFAHVKNSTTASFDGGGRMVTENSTTEVEGDEMPSVHAGLRLGYIREVITRAASDVTGKSEISPDQPLMSAGLNSLTLIGKGGGNGCHSAFVEVLRFLPS